MEIPLKALLIEDSDDDAFLILRELRRYGYQVTFRRVETAEAMSAALEDHEWDVVLADYALPHFDAFAALKLLRQRGLDVPFIILSKPVPEEEAVQALKAGAHDFIRKCNMARLGPAIERERQDARARRACREAETKIRRQLARF